MNAVASLPEQLRQLYAFDAELFVDGFELFEPAVYQDVNSDRDEFGELSEMVFFADDQSGGFFFLDSKDQLGLGEGFVCWVDRSMMSADEVIPLAPNVAEFLAILRSGLDIYDHTTLGDKSLRRLFDALESLPADVDARPPIDVDQLAATQQRRRLQVTYATGEILMRANGILFGQSGREFFSLDQMSECADGAVVIVGSDPALGHLGVTRGDWQDLPAERLIAFRDVQHPEDGQVLGRLADVFHFWIAEERGK